MSLKLIFFHLFTAMVAVNLIFAQDGGPPGFFGLPNFDNNNSNQSEPPSGPGPLGPRPDLPSLSGFGPQQNQSDEPQQQRTFFYKSRSYTVSCNYTAQAGATCPSCRTALVCYSNNVGRARLCRGWARYCNNGRCSIYPGSQC